MRKSDAKWYRIMKRIGDGSGFTLEKDLLLEMAERKCKEYNELRTEEDKAAGVKFSIEETQPPRGRPAPRRVGKPNRDKGRRR